MRNKNGLTAAERIIKDLQTIETTENAEQRKLLAYMAIAAAELAVDFNLITHSEWAEFIDRAFTVI